MSKIEWTDRTWNWVFGLVGPPRRAAAGRVAMLAGELGAAVLGGDWRRAGEAARALGEAAAVVAARGAR